MQAFRCFVIPRRKEYTTPYMRITFVGIVTAVFAALLPFLVSNHLFYGAENIKFLCFIGFIDVLLLWTGYALWSKKVKFSFAGKWFLYASVAVLAVEYLAAFLGVDPSRSLWSDITRSTGVLFITHVVLGMYLLAINLQEGDWSLLRKTVAISAALFSFLEFLSIDGFGLTSNFLWVSLKISGLTIANSTFAAAFAVLALILALIELSRTKSWDGWRYGLIACVTMILISPLLIGSNLLFNGTTFSQVLESPSMLLGSGRSSSVVVYSILMFMGGIFLLKKLPQTIRKVSLWLWPAAWLVAITIGLALLFTPGTAVQNAYIKASTGARIVVWESAMKGVADRPLLGWGPENFVYAFEKHFDNRLYLPENSGEVWFDRAHNVFVDTLIGQGVVGITFFTVLILALWRVVYRAHKKEYIGYYEAVLLAVLPIAHLVQNQTAFDTTVTYALLACIGGYLLWLEYHVTKNEGKIYSVPPNVSRGIAVLLIVLAFVSAKFVLFDALARQNALFATFTASTGTEQLALIPKSLSYVADFETLRLSSESFIKGFLVQLGSGKMTQASFNGAKQLMNEYEKQYELFLTRNPDYYRARIDYAYLLFIKTTVGEGGLDKAKAILKDTYALSPNNPITYNMDALAYMYGGDFKTAREKADASLALNPEVKFSQIVRSYIDKQAQTFPEITILKLENI